MCSQQCIDLSFATITVLLQIFVVQNLHEIAENHKNVNFRVKNFVIATFFRDYRRAAVPACMDN